MEYQWREWPTTECGWEQAWVNTPPGVDPDDPDDPEASATLIFDEGKWQYWEPRLREYVVFEDQNLTLEEYQALAVVLIRMN